VHDGNEVSFKHFVAIDYKSALSYSYVIINVSYNHRTLLSPTYSTLITLHSYRQNLLLPLCSELEQCATQVWICLNTSPTSRQVSVLPDAKYPTHVVFRLEFLYYFYCQERLATLTRSIELFDSSSIRYDAPRYFFQPSLTQ
jgi:hypothetical protein